MTEKIKSIVGDLIFLTPELILFAGFIFLILAGFFLNHYKYPLAFLAALLLIVDGIVLLQDLSLIKTQNIYDNMLHIALVGQYIKFLLLIGGLFTIFISEIYFSDFKRKGEYYAIILALILAGDVLIMGSNLLIVFVALELIALCSYVLVALVENKTHIESSIKYIYYGLFSAALTLFGFTFLYGLTGTMDFMSEDFIIKLNSLQAPVLLTVLLFSFSGILFKISAFPFHIWTPDVYQGAAIPVVAFLSIVPKLATFGFMLFFFNELATIEVWDFNIQHFMALLAIITLTVGNFGALNQNNAKRLMAYSAIAQGGFILTGFAAGNLQENIPVLFYLSAYLIMNLGAFTLLTLNFKIIQSFEINNFMGLGRKMPYVGILFLIVMISLTGIPPSLGFSGKLLLFSGIWETYIKEGNNLFLVLFIFGLINTVVALFFYLKIPYFMFIKEGSHALYKKNLFADYFIASILILPLLILFFKSQWLISLIQYFIN